MTGQTLLHYKVLEKLGAGGMGEVYRATDTKLGRSVAIKILPAEFARNPERLGRFEREARLLASLNHPNIAAIHGFEQAAERPFLVLEYVPGEILKGPLAMEEALAAARQIIEALEYAHDRGIIHRDLKPANIKITPDGAVKVLDFGLAKALAEEPESSDARNSPTLSVAATRAGAILGTAGYMSPEQAKGKPADRRADIWAFGVVLFEMLTGKPLYSGETVMETLASVVKDEPGLDRLPAETPPAIRRLLARCLDKDSKRRLQAIGEARLMLEQTEEGPQPPSPIPHPPERRQRGLPWAITALTLAALATLAVIHFREKPPEAPVSRYLVDAPEKATQLDYPAISPDGRRLAFVATVEGKRLLWVRPLDSLTPQALPGTEDASHPFWSPDSRHLGFFAQGKLQKIDASGGPPQTLCDTPAARGGAWNRDGVIIFTPGTQTPLMRVPAAGGVPAPLTTLDKSRQEVSHRWPQFLPDGRRFLYLASSSRRENSAVHVGSLDPQGGGPRLLLPADSMAAFAPPGYLLWRREQVLMAQRFDQRKLEPAGDPFPLVQQVGGAGPLEWAAFSVSGNGVLAYHTGAGGRSQLLWFDRAGKTLGPAGQPAANEALAISPDGHRVAVARRDSAGVDIWLIEPARETTTRFTFHAAVDTTPVWSPDGNRIVFSSNRDGAFNLWQKLSSGAAEEELLLKTDNLKFPSSWSTDGRFVAFDGSSPKTRWDLWVLPLEGERKPAPFLQTEFDEFGAQFSPDGRWLAYTSNETRAYEVYVQGFPKSGGKWQISTSGGAYPRWRRDGKELFYLAPDRRLMSVEVRSGGPSFEAAKPQPLFPTRATTPFINIHPYAVAADGKRFLINSPVEETVSPAITVVENWPAGVK